MNAVPAKKLDQAIDEYEVYMRHEKGNKMASAQTAVIWLRHFLPDLNANLDDISPVHAQALYDRYRTKPSVRTGKPLAADTHRNALAHAKTFYNWAIKKGYVTANPFAAVEGTGATPTRKAAAPRF
jgi:site-specific recombinase XerD